MGKYNVYSVHHHDTLMNKFKKDKRSILGKNFFKYSKQLIN